MTKESKTKRSTHLVYVAQKAEDGASDWTITGAAWRHRDGKGFNLILKDGTRFVAREPKGA